LRHTRKTQANLNAVSPECPRHDEETRTLVRRLARRKRLRRQAPPKIFPHQAGRRQLRGPHEKARGEVSASPYTSAQQIARAWADSTPAKSSRHEVALELARELQDIRGRIPAAIIEAMQARWKKNFAPITAFNHAYSLRKILRHIDRALGTNLAESAVIPRHPPPRQRIASDDETARLYAAAGPAMRMFLTLTSVMGFRFAEAERIGWQNYSEEKASINVLTKGGKYREFPVPDEVAALIHVTPKGEGSFIHLLHGKKISHKYLRDLWAKLRKKAGVPADLHPHDLRRTAAVRVYTLTKDVFAAKQLLGHDALASTAWYLTPHEPRAMRDAAHALKAWTPPKGEPKQ
jgi:site-specific recombinase XerD